MPVTIRLEVRPPTWARCPIGRSAGRSNSRAGSRTCHGSPPPSGQIHDILPVHHASLPRKEPLPGQAPRSMSGLRSWMRFTETRSSRSASTSSGGPSATTRCSSESTTQRSASSSSVGRSWVARTTVLPAPLSSMISSMSHCCVRGRARRSVRRTAALRVHHEHRRIGRLLPAGQLERGASARSVISRRASVSSTRATLVLRQAHVEGTEGRSRGRSARTPGRRSSGR